jgi:hypothetical protein
VNIERLIQLSERTKHVGQLGRLGKRGGCTYSRTIGKTKIIFPTYQSREALKPCRNSQMPFNLCSSPGEDQVVHQEELFWCVLGRGGKRTQNIRLSFHMSEWKKRTCTPGIRNYPVTGRSLLIQCIFRPPLSMSGSTPKYLRRESLQLRRGGRRFTR